MLKRFANKNSPGLWSEFWSLSTPPSCSNNSSIMAWIIHGQKNGIARAHEIKRRKAKQLTDKPWTERVSWKEKAKVNTIHQAFSINQSSSCHTVVSPIWVKCTKCTNFTVFKVVWQLALLYLCYLLLVIYAPLHDPERRYSNSGKNRHKHQQCWG